eukprot:15446522-Alexandrium_andersonii.AAC.1
MSTTIISCKLVVTIVVIAIAIGVMVSTWGRRWQICCVLAPTARGASQARLQTARWLDLTGRSAGNGAPKTNHQLRA